MVVAVNNGAWRFPKAVYAHDGVTWRLSKGVSSNNGAWRKTNNIAAMTVGNVTTNYGFVAGQYGALSQDQGADGVFTSEVTHNTSPNKTFVSCSTSGSQLDSATQTSYLKLASVAGVTVNTADCSAFILTPGPVTVAEWEWSGDVFSLVANNGGVLSVQLTLA